MEIFRFACRSLSKASRHMYVKDRGGFAGIVKKDVEADMSELSFNQIERGIKIAVLWSSMVSLGTYLMPDIRTQWYKEYQAKEFERDVEKAIAIYRERKRKAKDQNPSLVV